MTSIRKDVRMKRKTAEHLADLVHQRVREYNEDSFHAYRITRAVFFGSYVNSDCETLGDLDVAISFERRYSDNRVFDICCDISRTDCKACDPMLVLVWPIEEIYRSIARGHHYISVHNLEHDSKAVFSRSVEEIPIGNIEYEPESTFFIDDKINDLFAGNHPEVSA